MNRYIIKILKCQDEPTPRNKYYEIYKNCGYITLPVTRQLMYDSEYGAVDAAILHIKKKKDPVINFEIHIFDEYVCEITMDGDFYCRVQAQFKTKSRGDSKGHKL